MSRKGTGHAKRHSKDKGRMDPSSAASHYSYSYGGVGGTNAQYPTQGHQMAHQQPNRAHAASPMMVPSRTPPYFPPGASIVDPASGVAPPQPQEFVPVFPQQQPSQQRRNMTPMQLSAQYAQPIYQQNPAFYPLQPYPPPPPPGGTPPGGGAINTASVAGGAGGAARAGFAVAGMTAVNAGGIVRGTLAGSGDIDQLIQQDIERGLQIDFFSETDNTLLASWASFFRDQFLEARDKLARANYDKLAESYRRATHFVERVEMKVLKTNAMKQLFRWHPLTDVNDPIFVDTCYRTIIDYLSRNPPFDGFAFGNPTWRDYMWYKAGLTKVIDDGRREFLGWYAQVVRNQVDFFIETEISRFGASASEETGNEEMRRRITGALIGASVAGMTNEFAYATMKKFFISLYNDVISGFGQGGKQQAEGIINDAIAPSIIGRRVREVFHLDEEAFLLSVIRFHLDKETTKSSKEGPRDEETTPQDSRPRSSAVPSLSEILSLAVQISHLLASQEANFTVDSPSIMFNVLPGGEEDI